MRVTLCSPRWVLYECSRFHLSADCISIGQCLCCFCDEVGSGRYGHKTVSQSDKGNKDNKSTYAAFFLPLPLGLSCMSIIVAYSGSWVLYRYNINFSEDLNSHVEQTLISTKRLNNSVWRSKCKYRLTASAIWGLVNSWKTREGGRKTVHLGLVHLLPLRV
jgi:hypothetical protein